MANISGPVRQQGGTSQSIRILIRDSATMLGKTGLTNATAGLAFSYTRDLAASVAIALVAGSVAGAFLSGGFKEIDSVKAPGLYRLDVPDAAFAAGVSGVTVNWTGGGTLDDGYDVSLVAYDPTSEKLAADALSNIVGYTP